MDVATLTALAEPNRFNIVELLRGGPLSVGAIAQRLGLRQPQASKHLKVLADADIVEIYPQAQKRYYQLNLEAFKDIEAWAESHRATMEAQLDRLEVYLNESNKGA